MTETHPRTLLLAASIGAILLFPVADRAFAAPDPDLSYTYIELRATSFSLGGLFTYRDADVEARLDGEEHSAAGIAGSVRLHPHLYLTGEYTQDLDLAISARLSAGGRFGLAVGVFERRYGRLAIGTRFTLAQRLDLFAELGAEATSFLLPDTVRVDLPGVVLGLSSVGVERVAADGRLGLRLLATDRLELHFHGRYSQLQLRRLEIGDGGELELQDDVLFGVGAMFYPTRRFGVGASYELGEVASASVQLRWRL